MEEIARAKLNLALHVRGREPDGYHRIETLFAFCEHGDVLRVDEGEGLSLALEGPYGGALAAEPDNLVLRAARALRDRFAVRNGATLTLDKRLPVASGIGGGSADAAAALRLLTSWWGLAASEADLLEIARLLGADVPACVLSRTARGSGRGDALVEVDLPGLAGTAALLVNPGVPVPTGPVFRAWGGVDGGSLPEDFRLGRNDLQVPAIHVAPIIADTLAWLESRPGATLVRMSGSGATCFALFEDETRRDAAAADLAVARPDWWGMATRLC
ncbi:4-(cytidine 5'-diphospho)-2-C-methyl-D-erythritol kinase [Allosphingosinicella deserti]|nr:4-(cytidine 5'-diphospho)-2-C-methyl-D-erythritol kinase [Sphingomonas deserti]